MEMGTRSLWLVAGQRMPFARVGVVSICADGG
jgi:hypothetical protein